MIAQLSGAVESVGLDNVIVTVGGIGWRVLVGPATAQNLTQGNDVTLHTSLIVREDSLTLYGFSTADERDVFDRLMTVSGVGPRIALAALSVLSPDELRGAVAHEDLVTLQRVPGVGKKSAQRLIIEIGDKLGPAAVLPGEQAPAPAASEVAQEVRAALVQLGWSEAVAQKALDSLDDQNLDAPALLRAALLKLGGSRG